MAANNISVYILAGGKSSRMGTDKGLLPLGDKKIVEHVIGALKPLSENVFIVSSNKAYETFGLELVSDAFKNIGPAGGIHAALQHCKTPKAFICSCDTPFISSHAAEYLITESENFDICIPVFEGNIEPLFGVYSTLILSQWEEALGRNTYKLQDLFKLFQTKELPVDDKPPFGQNFFTNINTASDLDRALKNKNTSIKILAFGQLTDIFGGSFAEVAYQKDSDSLNQFLQVLYPALQRVSYRIAVNKKMITQNTPLNSQDEVALLPAFSGG